MRLIKFKFFTLEIDGVMSPAFIKPFLGFGDVFFLSKKIMFDQHTKFIVSICVTIDNNAWLY